MTNVTLRDNIGRIRGTIRDLGNGRREIRNPVGKVLGTYNQKDNVTRDNIGRVVGYGDLLTTLLED